MTRMNGQTKIVVATACCLALVDIGVRLLAPAPNASNCATCPPLSLGDGTIRARAIELVDADNNVRGLWNTDANGEPALWMYDRNGATRIELDTTENNPSLSFHDTDGNRRVYFGTNRDGTGLYEMLEPDSQTPTFRLDGMDNSQHFTLNGNGIFTETLHTRIGYDPNPPLPQQTVAQDVLLDQAEATARTDAALAEADARLAKAEAKQQSSR